MVAAFIMVVDSIMVADFMAADTEVVATTAKSRPGPRSGHHHPAGIRWREYDVKGRGGGIG